MAVLWIDFLLPYISPGQLKDGGVRKKTKRALKKKVSSNEKARKLAKSVAIDFGKAIFLQLLVRAVIVTSLFRMSDTCPWALLMMGHLVSGEEM